MTTTLMALQAEGLDDASSRALRSALEPTELRDRGDTFMDLFGSFICYKLRGEPMITALRHLVETGALDPDVAFHLIDTVAAVAVEGPRIEDPELLRINERLDVTRRQPDWLDADAFLPDDGFDYQGALEDEQRRRRLELKVLYLRRCGEEEMARLFGQDRRAYDRRARIGEKRLGCSPDVFPEEAV